MTYLYGEASHHERASFDLHLKECAACRDELRTFQQVRHEMSAWQPDVVSHLVPQISAAQPLQSGSSLSPGQMLRELFQAFPAWLKLTTAGMATAAATLVLFSLLGTRISVSNGNVDIAFGIPQAPVNSSASGSTPEKPALAVSNVGMLTRSEAEAMIRDAVAHAQAQAQNDARSQLAGLEQRLTLTHRAELKLATDKLRVEHRRQIALLEPAKTSLRDWMFTASDTQESGNADGVKSN